MSRARRPLDQPDDANSGAQEPPAASSGAASDDEMMRLVAELYYLRDQSQATIAELTGFSVSKVSRILSQARESGMVQISVEPAPERLQEAGNRLAQALDIGTAYVTPGRSDDPVRATRLCAVAAASWVVGELPAIGVLGLAGGYTITALVDALPARAYPQLTIVPIVGGWDPATPYLDINELARRMSERLAARCQLLHAPGRLDSVEVKRALMADSAIRVTTALWEELDAALVGISGGPLAAPGYTTVMDRLEAAERRRLRDRGVVGDIMGHLFDIDGNFIEDPTAERTIAAPVETMRRTRSVIAIAAGPHKIDGIIGACRTGLITTLITDQPTTEGILKRLAATPARPVLAG